MVVTLDNDRNKNINTGQCLSYAIITNKVSITTDYTSSSPNRLFYTNDSELTFGFVLDYELLLFHSNLNRGDAV